MRTPVSNHFKSSSRPLTAVLVMLSVLIIGLGLSVANAAPPPRPGPLGADRLDGDTNGAAIISYGASGYASFVRIPASAPLPLALDPSSTARQVAENFFDRYGGMFGIENANDELAFLGADNASLTGTQLVFQQEYYGIPVFAAILKARFNEDNRLTGVNGDFLAGIDLKAIPDLSVSQANQIAVATVAGQNAAADTQRTSLDQGLSAVNRGLYVFRSGLAKGVPGSDHLVYEVVVSNAEASVREFVYVDAHTKAVVDQITGVHDAKFRRAFDAEGFPQPGPNYPATPFWVEGDAFPTASTEADNMILASGETYDLFDNAFGRDSFDDAGATMDSIFNRGDGCPNASWNGVYISFCPGLTTDDITGHEWGHAYTEYTNNLIYQWQSGALNEAYSDMWGETVDLINGRGLDAPGGPRSDGSCSDLGPGPAGDNSYRWLMGEESSIGSLRDMWTPTCAGDPGKVTDAEYWCSTGDNGGVHFNSGVPNHAFALITDGGTYNSETITGLGLTKAVHIHWGASLMLTPASDFVDHADALEASCDDLRVAGTDLPDLSTGAPSGEVVSQADCDEVGEAVDAVELRTPPTQCNFEPLLDPNAPALCSGLGTVQPITSEDFEGGILPAGWTIGTRDVANPGTFDTPDWAVVSGLPAGAGGSYAAFVEDIVAGDCAADTEAGVLFLDSPVIALPLDEVPRVAIDHWVATELGWDGGNVKVSVNAGPWTLVPASEFSFNPYNSALNVSDNPLGGEEAFTGTNGGANSGSWGQSQVTLVGLALPGDDVQLRFDFGVDGCNGLVGWYVDEVQFYSCSDEEPPFCGDGGLDLGEQCDDGNPLDGDGCSSTCEVESGWICNDPTPPSAGGNIVADWSFEGGVPNADWTPFSTFGGIAGFPLCGPGNGCPAASLANTGSWLVWIGGLAGGVTSTMEQDVVIPAAVTELTLLNWRGICDDPSDTLHVKLDGADIGTISCDAVDPGWVEYTFPVAPFNDGASHTLHIGGTVGGTNGGHSNFFVEDVVMFDSTPVQGSPSQCFQLSDNLACGDIVGFDAGIAGDWSVVDNEGNGVVWTDIASSGIGGNWTGGTGDAASANSDAFQFVEFDTELRSNSFSIGNHRSASLNYLVNYQNLAGLDFLDVDISTDGGSNWTNLLSWNEDHPVGGLFLAPGEAVSIDLADYLGEPDVQVRWHYYDPNSSDWDWYAQVDNVGLNCEITQVLVDILPNRINAKKKRGVIPVAIYSSADFDATTVDPRSVAFGPNGTHEAHGRGHIRYVDGDGLLDMLLHFSNMESGIECGDTAAGLSGFTNDGEPIEGFDTFTTRGCR